MAPTVDLRVSADPTAAVEAAAVHIARAADDTVAVKGQVHIAFSGGSTGTLLVRALATQPVDWSRVHIRQVDERVAPDGHADRNATALRTELLDRVPIPAGNVQLMDVTATDLDGAARAYASSLGSLDVVHLGLGADGHTASWPPDQPEVRTAHELVRLTAEFNDYRRMTLTQRAIAAAHQIVWLVCGADKHQALDGAFGGDRSLPAMHALSLVGPQLEQVVFADAAAAG
jgi:6-phosphogluconolactonase